ncbi:hypothetical protein NDU88_002957 [Pleurodeles waltl]|uniref:Uncharacterized protein n=1 Tax=Pleurodeles waltl TaxID=8319 RepID=A0AAV7T4Q6_PLEWA|nr:hypothetical protein NDU88_002957 [Pleurodeles waltl]
MRNDLAQLDSANTHNQPLIELFNMDSIGGEARTAQDKKAPAPHLAINLKDEEERSTIAINLGPFQECMQNSQLQSEVPARAWGSLLSTLYVLSVVIKHQNDKQVDLLNIMANYIVGINSKLQALNDLIHRAQYHNYIRQARNCTAAENNPHVIASILNEILKEVRAQALSTRERFQVIQYEEQEKKATIKEISPNEILMITPSQESGHIEPRGSLSCSQEGIHNYGENCKNITTTTEKNAPIGPQEA